MSDETTAVEPADPARDVLDHDANAADAQAAAEEGEVVAPQGPGDAGYEPPAIIPELDGAGGTKFVMGEEEFGSMADAVEARNSLLEEHAAASEPDDEEVVDEEDDDAEVVADDEEQPVT